MFSKYKKGGGGDDKTPAGGPKLQSIEGGAGQAAPQPAAEKTPVVMRKPSGGGKMSAQAAPVCDSTATIWRSCVPQMMRCSQALPASACGSCQ